MKDSSLDAEPMSQDIVQTPLSNEHERRILKSKLSSLVAVNKGEGVTDEDHQYLIFDPRVYVGLRGMQLREA